VDLGIRNRVALVAASSKGLGREAARSLAQEGTDVVLCARNGAALKEAAGAIRGETGAELLDVVADLTVEKDVKGLVEQAIGRFGTIDILVNNCGGPPPGVFLDHDLATWRQAVENNLMSAISLTRLVVPYMIKKKWGRIVNITSISVKQPVPNLILSNSVRAAVVGWARTLANELASHNILVNSICQGYFLTERLRNLAENRAKGENSTAEKVLEGMASEVPLGRVANQEEFGPLVAFLASEKASYITGTTITIDGGLCRFLL